MRFLEQSLSIPLLPPEQREALRAVAVHGYFGIHGAGTQDYTHGPQIIGVTDGDYESCAQIAHGLNAARGDIYAMEQDEYQQQPLPYDVVATAHDALNASPYAHSMILGMDIAQPGQTLTTNDVRLGDSLYTHKDDLQHIAGEVRALQLIHPPAYGQLLAVMQGVRPAYADRDQRQSHQWQAFRHETHANQTFLEGVLLTDSLWAKGEMRYRDACIVKDLGHLATTMHVADAQDPPHLVWVGGAGGHQAIGRLLAANGVRMHMHTFSPQLSRRRRHRATRHFASAFLPGVMPYADKAHGRWIANAQKYQAQRG